MSSSAIPRPASPRQGYYETYPRVTSACDPLDERAARTQCERLGGRLTSFLMPRAMRPNRPVGSAATLLATTWLLPLAAFALPLPASALPLRRGRRRRLRAGFASLADRKSTRLNSSH